MPFYTGQYTYRGDDRLDITVAGQHPIGKVFAPTWELVNFWQKAKKDSIKFSNPKILLDAQDYYTKQYRLMMYDSLRNNSGAWLQVLSQPVVTFVCFCPKGGFCHRYILMDILTELGAMYIGDR